MALKTRLATVETEASLVQSQATQAQGRLEAAEERLGKLGQLEVLGWRVVACVCERRGGGVSMCMACGSLAPVAVVKWWTHAGTCDCD